MVLGASSGGEFLFDPGFGHREAGDLPVELLGRRYPLVRQTADSLDFLERLSCFGPGQSEAGAGTLKFDLERCRVDLEDDGAGAHAVADIEMHRGQPACDFRAEIGESGRDDRSGRRDQRIDPAQANPGDGRRRPVGGDSGVRRVAVREGGARLVRWLPRQEPYSPPVFTAAPSAVAEEFDHVHLIAPDTTEYDPWLARLHVNAWRPLLCAAVALAAAGPLAAQEPGTAVEAARFHHIRLNVTDIERSVDFYRTTFGALPIKFRGVADALYTERSFILFNEVEEPPDGSQRSGIWHFGWGGVDLPSQYRWLVSRGVDIHTPIYRLGRGHVIYVNGPDREMIEVNTMGHHRFAHIHLFAADVNETAAWYERHFGLRARRTAEGNPRPVGPDAEFATWEEFHREHRAWSNAFRADNMTFIVYNLPDYEPVAPWWPAEAPPLLETEPQRGRAIDHFALSYRDIEPVFERLKASGVEIVEPITYRPELDMRSFFVMGPDKVTVEVVEARPIPEGVWD